MMRNFIFFFFGHEGSSALLNALIQFPGVHAVGFEPFDRYVFFEPERKGFAHDISKDDLLACLACIYDPEGRADAEASLNAIYGKYRRKTLHLPSEPAAIGLKMRIHDREAWEGDIFELLRQCGVIAFVLERRNILRWALSRYDRERSQFDAIVSGGEPLDDRRIQVNCSRLRVLMRRCDQDLLQKRKLVKRLKKAAVETHVVRYEDFCNRKTKCVQKILDTLGVQAGPEAWSAVLEREGRFRKVHSDRIEAFVSNDAEVRRLYWRYRHGGRFADRLSDRAGVVRLYVDAVRRRLHPFSFVLRRGGDGGEGKA